MQATSSDTQPILDALVTAAHLAGTVIRTAAAKLDQVVWQQKGIADFVSAVDMRAETLIAETLLARFPDAHMIGEELSPGHTVGAGLTFIADPLDGTTNFLHGYPEYAVSIGALIDGDLAAGVILNAATGELFTAAAGRGAFRNNERITVSPITDPTRALIGTGFPFKRIENLEQYLRQFEAVVRHTSGIRRAGAAALDLANVACGRFEAFWELGLAPWDVAAGFLLIREAGGVVTDLAGHPATPVHGPVVAGNPAIHAWILNILHTDVTS